VKKVMLADMKDKVCMVTGANSGIGKIVSMEMARMGAHVVMVCRNMESGEQARSEIVKNSGNENVELFLADFRSLKSVRDMASEYKANHKRLHVLLNNIAIIPTKRRVTPDGFEEQFEVNHLSHFLLTHLLLDTIKASAPSRIINTSSGIHVRAKIDFEDLQFESRYNSHRVYGNTKLMNILFTYELARRLRGTRVTANAYTPGFSKTRLDREYSSFMRGMVSLMAKKPEKGAQTAIYLATSQEVETISGKYFQNKKTIESSQLSYDKEVGSRLWNISEKLTGLEGFWNTGKGKSKL
jgi:NAD(P)-dependent dehydrogenase (short-subunit alcohol dehydrogenase family)